MKISDLKIRKVRKKDLGAVARIFREEFGKPPYREKWTKKEAIKRINNYSKISSIFVLEKGKHIVGFIIFRDYRLWEDMHIGSIDEIVVSSKFQQRGAGTLLINHAEDYFRKKDIRVITCMSNRKSLAFKFYKKKGFTINRDKVFMEKILK